MTNLGQKKYCQEARKKRSSSWFRGWFEGVLGFSCPFIFLEQGKADEKRINRHVGQPFGGGCRIIQGAVLEDDEFPEALYATLTAWGMNRFGGGPKLKNHGDFKANLLSIADYVEEIRGFNILQIMHLDHILYSSHRPCN